MLHKVESKIEKSWYEILSDEFSKDYFCLLKSFLNTEKLEHQIFPKNSDVFNAYNLTPFDDVKVVILGQDPYHGVNQSHGLAFSVNDKVKFPPSLRNILKELVSDIGCDIPKSGNLTSWAEQGVLLLNVVLTVRARNAGSHQNKGWEFFTDATIKALSKKHKNIVFILWGKSAQSKEKLIDNDKHFILKAPHPSPLSSFRGFFGSKPFSQTNQYLLECKKKEIKWCL